MFSLNTIVVEQPKEAPKQYRNLKISNIDTVTNATIPEGTLKKVNKRYTDKEAILKAIVDYNYDFLRDVSDFFSVASGIYQRLCKYMADMYRYDWYITPYFPEHKNPKAIEMMAGNRKLSAAEQKSVETFYQALDYMDRFEVKRQFQDIALKVVKYGAFYGYLMDGTDRMLIQELPLRYCRSRFNHLGKPAVEFNLVYFDVEFKDELARKQVLDMFPPEFKKAYKLYKKKQIKPIFEEGSESWFIPNQDRAFKINAGGTGASDMPMMISVIPALIELDEAQGLAKQKLQQEIIKLVVQKLPLDKNSEMVFDPDECKDIHNNAVRMVAKAIGVNVLTTFADVDVNSLTESSQSSVTDTVLDAAKNNVFDESGVSQMQFNSENSVSLEKSILNDEASLYNMILQMERVLNDIMQLKYNNKKNWFKVQILSTTIYNYKEMSKLYKEQTQLGFSKMLPQVALGQSQSSILANVRFENEMLQLWDLFIPPLMSSTMSGDFLNNRTQGTGSGGSKSVGGGGTAPGGGSKDAVPAGDKKSGRPTNESQGKPTSEKTAANKEAM